MQTHICVESYRNIPYGLTDLEVSPTVDRLGNPAVQFCFNIESFTCEPSFCCDMDVAKVGHVY